MLCKALFHCPWWMRLWDGSNHPSQRVIKKQSEQGWTLKQYAEALPFVPMCIAKITLSVPYFKTHFKEASGHTAILLWSPHAPSPLQNRWRSPLRGGHLHPARWNMGLTTFSQLYIAYPRAGGQSSCSSASKHSLSKEHAPSACWATGCKAPPRSCYPTPPVRLQQPEEWTGTPRGLPCPWEMLSAQTRCKQKEARLSTGKEGSGSCQHFTAALQTAQPPWHHLMAVHASKCLGHFPSGVENPCLSVLLIASWAHRQLSSGYRTSKATLSCPNNGAWLLLQLLLQKDTDCCLDICIQGRRKGLKFVFKSLKGWKGITLHHPTIWELEDCQAEISPPTQLLWGCRGRVLYDILTYCPTEAKFSSN